MTDAPGACPPLAPEAAQAIAERKNNWQIHVDVDNLDARNCHHDGPPLYSVFLRLDRGLMSEEAAKLMAAHFAKALGLDTIIFHVR